MAPYRPDQQVEEDDDLMDESQGKGIRVMGVAYAPSRFVCFLSQVFKYIWFTLVSNFGFCSDRDTPVFCALINGEGEVVDFLRLPYFMKRRNAFREDEREKKVQSKCVHLIEACICRNCFPGIHLQLSIFRPTTLKASKSFYPARSLMWLLLPEKTGKYQPGIIH